MAPASQHNNACVLTQQCNWMVKFDSTARVEMLQRMTNPKQSKGFVCLTWARRPGVTVCGVGSASWWFKFLLEEMPITHIKRPQCHSLLSHRSSDDRRATTFYNISSYPIRTPALSCLRCVSKECSRSMRLDMPCSRVSSVWCWGSWPEKLSLKLRRASLTSCSSSPWVKQ